MNIIAGGQRQSGALKMEEAPILLSTSKQQGKNRTRTPTRPGQGLPTRQGSPNRSRMPARQEMSSRSRTPSNTGRGSPIQPGTPTRATTPTRQVVRTPSKAGTPTRSTTPIGTPIKSGTLIRPALGTLTKAEIIAKIGTSTGAASLSPMKAVSPRRTEPQTNNQISPLEMKLSTARALVDKFKAWLACNFCYNRKRGSWLYEGTAQHTCRRSFLVVKEKKSRHIYWDKVRKNQSPKFFGKYEVCSYVKTNRCTKGDECTYALNETEIGFWNLERKGVLSYDHMLKCKSGDPLLHLGM